MSKANNISASFQVGSLLELECPDNEPLFRLVMGEHDDPAAFPRSRSLPLKIGWNGLIEKGGVTTTTTTTSTLSRRRFSEPHDPLEVDTWILIKKSPPLDQNPWSIHIVREASAQMKVSVLSSTCIWDDLQPNCSRKLRSGMIIKFTPCHEVSE